MLSRRSPSVRRPVVQAVLAVGVVAILATGCSAGSAVTSTTAPSKASYDAHADALCAKYNRQLNALGSKLNSPTATAAQIEAALNQAATEAGKDAQTLADLPRPAGESSRLQQAYDTQNQGIALFRRMATAVGQQNQSAFQTAQNQLNSLDNTLNQQFDALGLRTCGSGSG